MTREILGLLAPGTVRLPRRLMPEDLDVLETLARRYNLLPLVYNRLSSAGPDRGSGAEEFLRRIRPLYLANVARVARQDSVRNDLLKLLETRGLEACHLKGSIIASDVFGDANSRSSSDIDLLVREADVFRVHDALTSWGCSSCESLPLGFLLTRTHHALYQHIESGEFVEVHWNFGVPFFFNLKSADIWDEIKPDQNGILKLSPDMLLVQTLIHHFMHAFRDLKILVDILWILDSYKKTIDYQSLVHKLNKARLVRAGMIALVQLCEVWPDERISAPARDLFATLDFKKNDPLVKAMLPYFRMNTEQFSHDLSLRDKVMMRFALDQCSTIVSAFAKTLFPLPEAIEALYDDRREWMLPVNYGKFIYWRVIRKI